MRESLQMTVSAMPGPVMDGMASSVGSRLRLLEQCKLNLVLLDTEFEGNEVWVLFRQILAMQPDAALIVLAKDSNLMVHAGEIGVSIMLDTGVSTVRLVSAIAGMMRSCDSPWQDNCTVSLCIWA